MKENSQNYYIEKIKSLNESYSKDTGKQKLVFCRTYGCQMNVHDSEKIVGIFLKMGYSRAADEKSADVVVYNTCCVRENAENKVYGHLSVLKNIKESKPGYKIIVCGCMMQQGAAVEKLRNTYKYVDIVMGTFNLHKLPGLLWANHETGSPIIDVWKQHEEIDRESIAGFREYPFKASVNIMYGCNNYCSYCIVPYVRGRERSRQPEDILLEIKTLAEEGVKEVLLLGQNVNSYGAGLGGKIDFAGLLEMASKIGGIERIRFLTSHPKDLSSRLIYAMRDLDKVCKHLHLPFQSGSSRILELMNRKYTKGHYLSLISKLKEEIPGISVTTDIIVGFPGETEEDFLDTLDVAKRVRFSSAYTFYYSAREGTPAAVMTGQVASHDAKDRFSRLLDVVNPIVYEINKSYEGEVFRVLVESISNDGVLTGRSDNNSIVHFKGEPGLVGKFADVTITSGKPFYLIGEKTLPEAK